MYLTTKTVHGDTYFYVEEKAWIDGKSRRLWQKYLGPADKFKDLDLSALISKHADKVQMVTLNFGLSAALWYIASKINLVSMIDAHASKERHQNLTVGEYITIAAINRCVAPCSKTKLSSWFSKDWLHTRFNIDPAVFNAQTYWNQFQALDEGVIEAIELAIDRAILAMYPLDMDRLLFDPTNFYTYSHGSEASLLQCGHSKQNQNGLRLVNYSLLCTRDFGIPLMHHTYAGNEQDAKAFKGIPARVEERMKALGKDTSAITVVFDKGNHSPAAFKIIDELKLHLIASARNSMHKDLMHEPREKFTSTMLPVTGKVVEYFKTTRSIYDVDRDVYVVLDPRKHEKHVMEFRAKLERKRNAIDTLFKARLNVKKWCKKTAVEKKVKSMIGKRPFKDVLVARVGGVDQQVTLSVVVDSNAQARYEETLGRSIIFTNRQGWTPEQVIWGYREQYVVEHAFKMMKCPGCIAIRPMFHHANASVRAHVFTCVISLLLLSLLRAELSGKGIHESYGHIIDALRDIHVNEITLASGKPIMYKMERVAGLAGKMVKSLGLNRLLR
nr:IS1634 family transposase [Candidatus Sigynarchaeota archaeon]